MGTAPVLTLTIVTLFGVATLGAAPADAARATARVQASAPSTPSGLRSAAGPQPVRHGGSRRSAVSRGNGS